MKNGSQSIENKKEEQEHSLKNTITQRLQKNPKKTFIYMIVIIIISIAFAIIRTLNQEPIKNPLGNYSDKSVKDQVLSSTGVGNIVDLGSAYLELKDLQKEIDLLLLKKELSGSDSLKLLQAFEQLNIINKKVR